MIVWHQLEDMNQLDELLASSSSRTVMILKHSTRCSISSMAKRRLEREWDLEDQEVQAWYLDLIAHRDVSNAIAEKLGVEHQSPQIILIKDGKAVLDQSHNGISASDVREQAIGNN